MSADDLEITRYIGERLRGWRQERDWSGQEAASHLAANISRAVEWSEIRRYEEGAALPDTLTATHLATVYGRDLVDLLLVRPTSEHSITSPWPPQVTIG